MSNGKAKAHGCAIVEDVHRETRETDYLGEAIDDVRDILKRVSESAGRRHVGLSKTGQIGSDEAKPVGQLRDEIAEHVAGGGKAVQQKNCWRVIRASLAVENADAVDIDLPVCDRAHGNPLGPIASRRSCRTPDLIPSAAELHESHRRKIRLPVSPCIYLLRHDSQSPAKELLIPGTLECQI